MTVITNLKLCMLHNWNKLSRHSSYNYSELDIEQMTLGTEWHSQREWQLHTDCKPAQDASKSEQSHEHWQDFWLLKLSVVCNLYYNDLLEETVIHCLQNVISYKHPETQIILCAQHMQQISVAELKKKSLCCHVVWTFQTLHVLYKNMWQCN